MDLLSRIEKLTATAHHSLSPSLPSSQWAEKARDLLDEHFFDFHLDPELLLVDFLNQDVHPQATFPSLGFSHHPVTLYASELFNLDLYFWLPSDTLPHDHGFHGAFMPLWGDYAQTIYEFKEEQDLGEGVVTGVLKAGEAKLLPNNKAHTILHAPKFIHAVLHESFCVTIVLRSKNQGEVLSDYYSHFKIKNLPSEIQKAQADWQRLDLLTHLQSEQIPQRLKSVSSARLVRWVYHAGHNSRLQSWVKSEALTRSELKSMKF